MDIQKEFFEVTFIRGVRDYLIRLFLNILDNAIKYSDFGGIVRVRMRREKDQAIIEIEDSGQGIPKPKFLLFFSRFTASKTIARGLGAAPALVCP